MLHIWSLVLKALNKCIKFNLFSIQWWFSQGTGTAVAAMIVFGPLDPRTNKECMWWGWQDWSSWAWQRSTHERKGWTDGGERAGEGKKQGMNRITHWDPAVHSGRCRERGWGGGSWEVMGRCTGGFTEWRKGACEGWGATGWVAYWGKWRTHSGSVSANPVDGYRRVGPLVVMVVFHNPWTPVYLMHVTILDFPGTNEQDLCDVLWGKQNVNSVHAAPTSQLVLKVILTLFSLPIYPLHTNWHYCMQKNMNRISYPSFCSENNFYVLFCVDFETECNTRSSSYVDDGDKLCLFWQLDTKFSIALVLGRILSHLHYVEIRFS